MWNGKAYPNSQVLNVPPGNHTLSVATPQSAGGVQYVFQSWSDGNTNASRTIAVGAAALNYQAIFTSSKRSGALHADVDDSRKACVAASAHTPRHAPVAGGAFCRVGRPRPPRSDAGFDPAGDGCNPAPDGSQPSIPPRAAGRGASPARRLGPLHRSAFGCRRAQRASRPLRSWIPRRKSEPVYEYILNNPRSAAPACT